MKRIILVSNRLPVTVTRGRAGIKYKNSGGGLATGLSSFYKNNNCLWIGWPGIITDDKNEKSNIKKFLFEEYRSIPIFLSESDISNYYSGFSNNTLWPLFHYFPQYVIYNQKFWDYYKLVNKKFARIILKNIEENDSIWIHDYHLMLLPNFIREKLPNIKIGFFLHIPFPSFEIFRLLPWRRELLEGLLGSDLIGFHTYDYVRHFLSSVLRILGYESSFTQINYKNRDIKADAFPMGIDYKKFNKTSHLKLVYKEKQSIKKEAKGRKIIISVDRLDYTKGIIKRLEAFELFLEIYPEYKEKVTVIMVEVPSRVKVKTYANLKVRVDQLVGKINGKYGTLGWVPIWYLYKAISFSKLVALYSAADIAIVTPIRDGMNLIAKEFVAAKNGENGVLILSETAGAANELGDALIVNPNNKYEVCDAIKKALTMSKKEQKERLSKMQYILKNLTIKKWANLFIEKLNSTEEKRIVNLLTSEEKENLVSDFHESKRRLLLLDYDGTLVPFSKDPQKAKPDKKLLSLIKSILRDERNKVVLVSGRDRKTLDKWFKGVEVGLIAEHGVWIKMDGDWKLITRLTNKWKKRITPLINFQVIRTPGSFLEEKEYSLVWHFRNVDSELAAVRKNELMDIVRDLASDLDLGIFEGNKIIEIKNKNINKGKTASFIISRNNWDFILAIGDDKTDEDLFEVVSQNGYSIKVGTEDTKARFRVSSYLNVRELLEEFL
jgi:trehalose 6-phosphate synthase/phosphatase